MLNESPSFLQRYRDPIGVALLLLLPVIFYVANNKEPRDHNVVDRVVVWISWPVQWAIVGSLDGVSNLWHSYVGLIGVQEENDALRSENAQLRAELNNREEMRFENERFRRLLGLQSRSAGVDLVYAAVIGIQPTPLFRSLRLDVGEADGIRLGTGVLSNDGVIGRVAALDRHTCDVMLLVDAASSVDVLVQRTRAHARARGSGGDRTLGLDLEYVPRTADIEPMDLLITSGIGSVFPKGIPVARVTRVERGNFGLYQSAAAEPLVDFRHLEEVLVIRGRLSEGINLEGDPPAPSEDGGSTEPVAAHEGAAPAPPVAPLANP